MRRCHAPGVGIGKEKGRRQARGVHFFATKQVSNEQSVVSWARLKTHQ